jgi:predicted O-methyltransferase YrrM
LGKPFWNEAGVADRIDLRLGPASGTLAAMIDAGEAGTYDFAFIDADKEAYDGYYEQCLTLLRPGGVVTLDNIFMNGSALAPKPGEAGPNAVHALTKKIVADQRVDSSLIPIGDGLLAARKR